MISKIIYRSGDGGVGWVVGSGKRDLTPGPFELHILPTPLKWNTNYVKWKAKGLKFYTLLCMCVCYACMVIYMYNKGQIKKTLKTPKYNEKCVYVCVCMFVCVWWRFRKKTKKISQKECFVCYILDNKFRVLLYVYVFNAGFLLVGDC